MKKTSRRRFAKQLTGAIVATAASSIVSKGGQRPNVQKSISDQKFFNSHNTPPPLEFINGSLVSENAVEFSNPVMNGNRKEYHLTPRTGSVIYPAHIRILAGNGEQLYYKDGSNTYTIEIELRDDQETEASSLIVNAQSTANQDKFVVDVDSNNELRLGNHANNDKPSSKKRGRRYRHSADLSMYKVTVKNGASIKKTIPVRDLGMAGADLRIMIWLEPWA